MTTWQGLLVAWSDNANLPKRNKMTNEISDKARENLRRNEESRKKESKYVKLDPGEKIILHFDPEKMGPVDGEFDGKLLTV